MNFLTKDNLSKYLISGHLHLSKKDFGFFSNITYLSSENKSITSNQNKLFDKLLDKYQRQLTKLGHNIQSLKTLDWKCPVIETRQDFLNAKIAIINNKISIRCPFNTQFVQNFRKADNNNFIWNKAEKMYEAEFNTYNFKLALTYVNKFFKDILYCQPSQNFLSYIETYETIKYWNPTLIKVHNNFYISAINENLYEATKHIKLSDSPKTLYLLSQFGIEIEKNITKNDDLLVLAANYHVYYDLENLQKFIDALVELEVDHVFTSRDIIYNKEISKEVKQSLLNYNITTSKINETDKPGILITSNKSYHNQYSNNITKIVYLANSRPVQVS
jgi:hypothetical protein